MDNQIIKKKVIEKNKLYNKFIFDYSLIKIIKIVIKIKGINP